MFTKWRRSTEKIDNEYNQLRKLSKWRFVLHHTPATMDERDSDTPLSYVEDGAFLREIEFE